MTLSTNVPTSVSGLLAALATMVADVNALWTYQAASSWLVSGREEVMAPAQVSFASVDVPVEVIYLDSAGAVDLDQITGARAYMLKVLVAKGADVTVKHSTEIILDGAVDLAMTQYTALGLINIGGDPDLAEDGIWIEVFRSVK